VVVVPVPVVVVPVPVVVVPVPVVVVPVPVVVVPVPVVVVPVPVVVVPVPVVLAPVVVVVAVDAVLGVVMPSLPQPAKAIDSAVIAHRSLPLNKIPLKVSYIALLPKALNAAVRWWQAALTDF
jgi:hypothetical protein